MFIVGITGGIGSGKSTLAQCFKDIGIQVVDADQISRDLTAHGGLVLPEIAKVFGDQVFDENGNLLRARLSEEVFKDKKKLDLLEKIVHQEVVREMQEQIAKAKKAKQQAIALDVPIPVKHGFLDTCDQIWCVWADQDIRLERLEKRGMTKAEALRRMQVQLDEESYRELSDHFLLNNGAINDLRKQAFQLIETEFSARGIHFEFPENTD